MLATLPCLALACLQATPTAIDYPGLVLYPAFGTAVALDGDSLIVGSMQAKPCCNLPGEAHVFTRNGSQWDVATRLSTPNSDRLGFAVALEGPVAAAAEHPGNFSRVAVAERTAGAWNPTLTLHYPGLPAISAGFGSGIAIEDGRLIVGASGGRETSGSDTGVVYVYESVAGTWTLVQTILPPASASGQIPTRTRFGHKVAAEGDLLVISAPNAASGGALEQGGMHIFRRYPAAPPSRRYQLEETLAAPALSGQLWFGDSSLEVSAGRIAVASAWATDQGLTQAGCVHVYENTAGSWLETARLHDPLPSFRAQFGFELTLSGDRLLVGRRSSQRNRYSDLPQTVEVYEPSAGTWVHTRTVIDPVEAGDTGFGMALSLDGVQLAAGLRGAVVNVEDRGACYVGDVSLGWTPIATVACGGTGCACPGRPYEGCGNGVLDFGTINGFGSTSVSRDDLHLTAAGLTPGTDTRLMLGRAITAPSPFGDGLLCVDQPAMLMPMVADTTGAASFPTGLVARATQQLGMAGAIAPGESWIFQAMYAEPRRRFGCTTNGTSGIPGFQNGRPYLASRGFNLSNAIQVTFTP